MRHGSGLRAQVLGMALVLGMIAAGATRGVASVVSLGLEIGGAAAIARTAPRVELRLEDGGRVVLDGIIVPRAVAPDVEAVLGPLLARAEIVVPAAAPEDRYGRLAIEAASPERRSLQRALLEAGLAVVQPLPGADPSILEANLAAEARAERAGRGIWRDPAAVVVGSARQDAADRLGAFVLIDGRVLQASAQQRYFYLNFGDDWRTDTTARIDRDVLRAMQRAGFEPAALEGRRVRVRGTLFAENGPMIELWTHQGIEILP